MYTWKPTSQFLHRVRYIGGYNFLMLFRGLSELFRIPGLKRIAGEGERRSVSMHSHA